MKKALYDHKCWLYGLAFHTMSLPLYTLSLFLVSISSPNSSKINLIALALYHQRLRLYLSKSSTSLHPSVRPSHSPHSRCRLHLRTFPPPLPLRHRLLPRRNDRLHNPNHQHSSFQKARRLLRRNLFRSGRNLPRYCSSSRLACEQCKWTDQESRGGCNANFYW